MTRRLPSAGDTYIWKDSYAVEVISSSLDSERFLERHGKGPWVPSRLTPEAFQDRIAERAWGRP